jgi:hypothetical protein
LLRLDLVVPDGRVKGFRVEAILDEGVPLGGGEGILCGLGGDLHGQTLVSDALGNVYGLGLDLGDVGGRKPALPGLRFRLGLGSACGIIPGRYGGPHAAAFRPRSLGPWSVIDARVVCSPAGDVTVVPAGWPAILIRAQAVSRVRDFVENAVEGQVPAPGRLTVVVGPDPLAVVSRTPLVSAGLGIGVTVVAVLRIAVAVAIPVIAVAVLGIAVTIVRVATAAVTGVGVILIAVTVSGLVVAVTAVVATTLGPLLVRAVFLCRRMRAHRLVGSLAAPPSRTDIVRVLRFFLGLTLGLCLLDPVETNRCGVTR